MREINIEGKYKYPRKGKLEIELNQKFVII